MLLIIIYQSCSAGCLGCSVHTFSLLEGQKHSLHKYANTDVTYAKFTLHGFSPIFHSLTGFDKSLTNVGGKSVLAHARDNLPVWMIKDTIWGHRRCIVDTREIYGMLNIWSCQRFTILLCEWVLTEKYISDDLQPMREQDTGQREARGGLTLAIYKTTCHKNIQIS